MFGKQKIKLYICRVEQKPMETKLFKTAKEFFKFLNNYEADIWIRGNKVFDVNGELIAEYNTKF